MLTSFGASAEIREIVVEGAPFPLTVKEWTPPNRAFDISDYGARPVIGDFAAAVPVTESIEQAIQAAAQAGGGRVVVPAGEWKCGAFDLQSNVALVLEKGAVLRFSDDPVVVCRRPLPPNGRPKLARGGLINAIGCTNVAVMGEGTVKCDVDYWYANYWKAPKEGFPRPHAFKFSRCRNVRFEGFRIRGSPSWTMHFVLCEDIVLRGVDSVCDGPNTDGLDLDSCRRALVENCSLSQTDNTFTIKSGMNEAGRRRNVPTEDVVIRNCRNHGPTLLAIGSEVSGGVRNIYMTDCFAAGYTRTWLRVKTNEKRGGYIENVWMENIRGHRALNVMGVDMFYDGNPNKELGKKGERKWLTAINGIHVKNVDCAMAQYAVKIRTDAELPPKALTAENIRIGYLEKELVKQDGPAELAVTNVVEAPREVVLPPGVCALGKTFEVTHGGTAEKPLVIRGADPLNPTVLSGGRRITGWQVDAKGVWRVRLAEVKRGKWNFSQLFVNGERRFRPTLPRAGFFETVTNAFATKDAIGGFVFKPGDVSAAWMNRADLELQILHTWSVTRARVGAIDEAAHTLAFAAPRPRNAYHCDFLKRRYRVENVKEAFGRPGEWYLDRSTGELAYTPLPGEDPDSAEVVAPVCDLLVSVKGTPEVPVRHVVFKDVVFAHQRCVTPKEGCFAVQSAFNLPPAVAVEQAEDIRFERCSFFHVGGYALQFNAGAKNCCVSHSLFRDLGGGGVNIGPFETEPDGRGGITVENCRITEGGRIFPAAVGVLIGRSSHNKVLHNEIDHLYYTGVSVGWNWGEQRPSRAHHNEIAYNRIHDIGQGLLSDMGLVYLLGRAPGTTVHDNYLRDIRTAQYGGTGIYPDEGSSELEIYNNFVLNTVRSYHQNYGETNRVYNNVFVNGREMQYDFRPRKGFAGETTVFERNIFVWRTGRLMQRGWPFGMSGEEVKKWNQPYERGLSASSNLYFHVGGEPVRFGKFSFAEWQAKGMEKGSVVGDPGFAGDVWAGDCALRGDSPALKLGFKPLDLAKTGIDDVGRLPPMPAWTCPTPYADVGAK